VTPSSFVNASSVAHTHHQPPLCPTPFVSMRPPHSTRSQSTLRLPPRPVKTADTTHSEGNCGHVSASSKLCMLPVRGVRRRTQPRLSQNGFPAANVTGALQPTSSQPFGLPVAPTSPASRCEVPHPGHPRGRLRSPPSFRAWPVSGHTAPRRTSGDLHHRQSPRKALSGSSPSR